MSSCSAIKVAFTGKAAYRVTSSKRMWANQAVAGTLPLTSPDLVYICILAASLGSKLLVHGDIHGAVLGKSVSSEQMTAAL